MQTINDVLLRLDEIIASCRTRNSRAGYFAVLYRQVTARVQRGIAEGEFEDNPRMARLVVIFAGRFIDAWNAFEKGGAPTQSWIRAFEVAENPKLLVLQHLLLGINAHINLDLGIAAVETMEGQPLEPLRRDFNTINEVLAGLVDGVKANIGRISPLFRLLIRFAKGRDEMLVNFSIYVAREGAWTFAQSYAQQPSGTRAPLLRDRDGKIAGLADRLIQPGKRLSRLVALISLAEWRSVASNMDQLNRMAGE